MSSGILTTVFVLESVSLLFWFIAFEIIILSEERRYDFVIQCIAY